MNIVQWFELVQCTKNSVVFWNMTGLVDSSRPCMRMSHWKQLKCKCGKKNQSLVILKPRAHREEVQLEVFQVSPTQGCKICMWTSYRYVGYMLYTIHQRPPLCLSSIIVAEVASVAVLLHQLVIKTHWQSPPNTHWSCRRYDDQSPVDRGHCHVLLILHRWLFLLRL